MNNNNNNADTVIDLVSDEEVEEETEEQVEVISIADSDSEMSYDDIDLPVAPPEGWDEFHRRRWQIHTFLLPGKPTVWKRHKAYYRRDASGTLRINNVNTNKAATLKAREMIKTQLTQNYGITEFPVYDFRTPLTLETEFYWPLPLSDFIGGKREKGCSLSQDHQLADTKKRDLDNLVKFVKDAMNGVMYADDSQVVVMANYKMKDIQPPHLGRTVVSVRRMKERDMISTNRVLNIMMEQRGIGTGNGHGLIHR